MKNYKVMVTPEAEKELKGYIAYLRSVKKNPQAVRNVLNDFKDTKTSLGNVAGSLKEPESEELRSRGLKRMNFLRHNYFLLYYIGNDEIVYITNIFHGLEDFENKLR